jgi:hypothetical protein
MGMVGAERRGEMRVELALRRPQPALRDLGTRLNRAREGNLLPRRIEKLQHHKQVRIFCG